MASRTLRILLLLMLVFLGGFMTGRCNLFAPDERSFDVNELYVYRKPTCTELTYAFDQVDERICQRADHPFINNKTTRDFPVGLQRNHFYLVRAQDGRTVRESLRDIQRYGRWPATYEELMAFSHLFPEALEKGKWIAATGSSTVVLRKASLGEASTITFVPVLERYESLRRVGDIPVDNPVENMSLLFVPNISDETKRPHELP